MQAGNSSRDPVVVTIQCTSTPAYQKGKPQSEARQMRVGWIRADFSTGLPLPRLLRGVRQPTFGIIRRGLDAYTRNSDGECIRGDRDMRHAQGMAKAADIVNDVVRREHLIPLAWTGLGNISQNLGCVAWTPQELVYCVPEGERLTSGTYRSLCMGNNGSVGMTDVRFVPGDREGLWNPVIGGSNARDRLHLTVSGQPLVVDGRPVDPYEDPKAAEEYADFRHLCVSAYVHLTDPATGEPACDPDRQPIRRDFGLDQILGNRQLREAAITGHVVDLGLDMTDVDGRRYTANPKELESALRDKGYSAVATEQELRKHERAGERGFYWIDREARRVSILFIRTPYPHHFYAVRREEPYVLYEGCVGGWSNNAGTNPHDLAEALVRDGFSGAILLDNGGDVVLVHCRPDTSKGWADPNGPQAQIPSCLGREQWAALLLYYADDVDPSASQALTISVNRDGVACDSYLEFRVEL